MKRLCTLLLLCLGLHHTWAQEADLKYGKVTQEELKMVTYSKDTTAEAVVIWDEGNTFYTYNPDIGFQIQSEFKKRVKILTKEGLDRATISIPYYSNASSGRDFVSGIEAAAYNLVDGKIVKTKLDRKYVFDEVVNDNYHVIKFSLSNVNVGSVIEYRYVYSTKFISDIPEWYFQTDIPVINSKYVILIPEFYKFNARLTGFENVKVNEDDKAAKFNIGNNETMTVMCKEMTFYAHDLPGLDDEVNVWCSRDYLSSVIFEIKGCQFPNEPYKSYAHTWKDIIVRLEGTDFSSNVRISNPYKEDASFKALISLNEDEKISRAYSLVKSKIKWNGQYSLIGDSPKVAVKEGTGDNAQINFVLLSMLKDLDIKAYPILMSRRSRGRLPKSFPTIDKLNTFVLAAETKDGRIFYMDGSATFGGLNVLPKDLLVDEGFVLDSKGTEKWVDLSRLTKNQQAMTIEATIDSSGNLTGKMVSQYTNQMALLYRSNMAGRDSLTKTDKIQNAKNIKIDSIKVEGNDSLLEDVVETIKFSRQLEQEGEFLYFNPMIFKHIAQNAFIQAERKLPIEFDYPYSYKLNCNITIPDNYKIEELPKSVRISLHENDSKCSYIVTQQDNVINIRYTFDINQILYSSSDYGTIKEYFGIVTSVNNNLVVLKR